MGMSKRTWGYARLSRDLGQSGIEAQTAAIHEYCARNGWDMVDVITEIAPAYVPDRTAPRPAFEALLSEVLADPEGSRLIVYNLDRLVREVGDLSRIVRWVQAGGEVHAVTGEIDLSTSTGVFAATVVVATKTLEVQELTRRVRANNEFRRAQGLPLGGGQRSFGYTSGSTKSRELVPDEAAFLRECMGRLKNGASWGELVADARARGFRTPRGKEWTRNNFSKLFNTPSLYGLIVHTGEDGTQSFHSHSGWEPIFPSEDYFFIQQLRRDRLVYAGDRQAQTPLTGVIECGCCDTTRRLASGGRKYRCVVCNAAVNKEQTLTLFLYLQTKLLPLYRAWLDGGVPEDVVDAVESAEAIRRRFEGEERELVDGINASPIPDSAKVPAIEAGLREVRARRDAALVERERAVRVAEGHRASRGKRAYFDAYGVLLGSDVEAKRAVFCNFFPRVVLHPFRREGLGAFQAERFEVELFTGEVTDALTLLERFGLDPVELRDMEPVFPCLSPAEATRAGVEHGRVTSL